MGMVTDVEWECPGCGANNIAQLYGDFYAEDEGYPENRPSPLSRKAIPSDAELKWNPPCEGCGKYRLDMPPRVLIELPVVKVDHIE